jgi:mRNA-degrading endonuclease RelE of RelBE toxin-antitoxin system
MSYKPAFSAEMQKELRYRKKKDKALYWQAVKKMDEVLENPQIGKPQEAPLVGVRRCHIGHFVIAYRIHEELKEVLFLYLQHHE